MDWGTLFATLIGLTFGAGLGLGSNLLTSARAERRELARLEMQAAAEHERWKRDRIVGALEHAFDSLSAVITSSHPDHEQWKRELATSNLIIRLYCGELIQGAFSSVKDGMMLVSENTHKTDQRAMQLLGEATSYLQVAARCELGIEGTPVDVEEAKSKFLSRAESARVADSD